MEGRKCCEHAVNIVITEIETRGFFQTFMPKLMPQHRNSDKLMTDKVCLFDKLGAMLAHTFHDVASRLRASGHIRFHCHCQWIHKGLRMRFANLGKQPMNRTPDPDIGLIDSSDKLRSDSKPSVDIDSRKSFRHHSIHLMISAMIKPQSE